MRMPDNRLIKHVLGGRMHGTNRRGRPCREWADDLTDWTGRDIAWLMKKTTDSRGWSEVVQNAVDTYGH